MAHEVFISYSSKDKTVADAVCAGLESRSIRCWVAPRDILPGMDWGASIIDAITGCRVMVLIFSGNANKSPQIKREVERAVAKGVKILPFRIEDVPMSKNLEYFISSQHWLDALTRPLEDHVEKLGDTIEALRTARDSRSLVEPPPPEPGSRRKPRTMADALESPREIPPTPIHRPKKSGMIAIVIAFAAVAVLYPTVIHKSPPQILAVNFPASIAATGRDVGGTVQFKTGRDPIAQAEFSVVQAQSFDSFSFQPRGVAGLKEGSFSFSIRSSIPQQVTLQATLVDTAGRRSDPVKFTFEAKRPAATGRKGFEIETPHGFKFKFPH